MQSEHWVPLYHNMLTWYHTCQQPSSNQPLFLRHRGSKVNIKPQTRLHFFSYFFFSYYLANRKIKIKNLSFINAPLQKSWKINKRKIEWLLYLLRLRSTFPRRDPPPPSPPLFSLLSVRIIASFPSFPPLFSSI